MIVVQSDDHSIQLSYERILFQLLQFAHKSFIIVDFVQFN